MEPGAVISVLVCNCNKEQSIMILYDENVSVSFWKISRLLINKCTGLIDLEIPVLVRSLKSSNGELG